MGAVRPPGRQLQHPRPQRREHHPRLDLRLGRRRLGPFHLVEVLAHARVGPAVLRAPVRGRRGVADAEAEHETVAVERVQRVVPGHRRERVARVDVGDAASDAEPVRLAEQEPADRKRFVPGRLRIPQYLVAQAIDPLRQLRQPGLVESMRRKPDAVLSHRHGWCSHAPFSGK